MKVLFASSECAPFFKTGGLGDVAGALPKELAKKSEIDSVAVILPYFKNEMKEEYRSLLKDEFYDFVDVGWRHEYVGVKSLEKEGVKYYFLDNEHYFGRGQLYGYGDDGERFAFFDLALCQLLEKLDFIPDVLHVNDWQTAMVPFLLKEKYNWIKAYEKIKTVLTIHNIEFQGLMHGDALSELFGMGMERYFEGVVRHNGMLNMLKTGILYADRVNTVSPTYAKEIQTSEFGCGLESILQYVDGKVSGILNGIDYDIYNPENDILIPYHFSEEELSGKGQMKAELQKRTGLPLNPNVPLIGMVSRLTNQKGFDLGIEVIERLCKEGYAIRWYIIGEGNQRAELEQKISETVYAKESIVLLGQQLNPYPYLKMCDIYFQPSRHEGYGIAVAEARAFCKPIVSTNFAGAQEQLINNETGIITECTIESMYRGVKLLLDNYNDFQHRFSKNLAAQKGIDKNQVCLLEQIFEQV